MARCRRRTARPPTSRSRTPTISSRPRPSSPAGAGRDRRRRTPPAAGGPGVRHPPRSRRRRRRRHGRAAAGAGRGGVRGGAGPRRPQRRRRRGPRRDRRPAGRGRAGRHRPALPDTDPRWRGADSLDLLARAVADLRAAGWRPQNVDTTVVLEAPKLAPRRAEMEKRLTDVVGAGHRKGQAGRGPGRPRPGRGASPASPSPSSPATPRTRHDSLRPAAEAARTCGIHSTIRPRRPVAWQVLGVGRSPARGPRVTAAPGRRRLRAQRRAEPWRAGHPAGPAVRGRWPGRSWRRRRSGRCRRAGRSAAPAARRAGEHRPANRERIREREPPGRGGRREHRRRPAARPAALAVDRPGPGARHRAVGHGAGAAVPGATSAATRSRAARPSVSC